jgi:ribosomal protein S6E (S10)
MIDGGCDDDGKEMKPDKSHNTQVKPFLSFLSSPLNKHSPSSPREDVGNSPKM